MTHRQRTSVKDHFYSLPNATFQKWSPLGRSKAAPSAWSTSCAPLAMQKSDSKRNVNHRLKPFVKTYTTALAMSNRNRLAASPINKPLNQSFFITTGQHLGIQEALSNNSWTMVSYLRSHIRFLRRARSRSTHFRGHGLASVNKKTVLYSMRTPYQPNLLKDHCCRSQNNL